MFGQTDMELITQGLNFPTSLAFDGQGTAYLAESGLPFGGARRGGRILRLERDGEATCLLDNLRQPVNGLTYHEGWFYISEGGYPGRISRLSVEGEWRTVLDGLPGSGNYHTNMVAVGPEGKLYFGQGAMTNSGIVGLDSYEIGWLKRLPHTSDVPGYDIVLTGVNIETRNPLASNGDRKVETGAFSDFGTRTEPGQRIAARVPCTAAVLRCNPDGSELELFAWGLRNVYGLGFMPDGRLLATDQGADDRGSRPVGNAPDLLFEVQKGRWYGWPDFVGGVAVIDPSLRPQRGDAPQFLLANHAELPAPEAPLLRFPTHCAAVKFAVAPRNVGRWAGHIFVALFGDETPMTGPYASPEGRCLARIDPADWSLHSLSSGPFARPIDVQFHPLDGRMYVIDFGDFEIDAKRAVVAHAGSGKLWKVPLEETGATDACRQERHDRRPGLRG